MGSSDCWCSCDPGHSAVVGGHCNKCTAGSTRRRRATSCTACGAGKYKASCTTGCKDNCDTCYGNVRRRRSTSCSQCSVGKYNAGSWDDCRECNGVVRRRRASSCTACPAGYTNQSGADNCTEIPKEEAKKEEDLAMGAGAVILTAGAAAAAGASAGGADADADVDTDDDSKKKKKPKTMSPCGTYLASDGEQWSIKYASLTAAAVPCKGGPPSLIVVHKTSQKSYTMQVDPEASKNFVNPEAGMTLKLIDNGACDFSGTRLKRKPLPYAKQRKILPGALMLVLGLLSLILEQWSTGAVLCCLAVATVSLVYLTEHTLWFPRICMTIQNLPPPNIRDQFWKAVGFLVSVLPGIVALASGKSLGYFIGVLIIGFAIMDLLAPDLWAMHIVYARLSTGLLFSLVMYAVAIDVQLNGVSDIGDFSVFISVGLFTLKGFMGWLESLVADEIPFSGTGVPSMPGLPAMSADFGLEQMHMDALQTLKDHMPLGSAWAKLLLEALRRLAWRLVRHCVASLRKTVDAITGAKFKELRKFAEDAIGVTLKILSDDLSLEKVTLHHDKLEPLEVGLAKLIDEVLKPTVDKAEKLAGAMRKEVEKLDKPISLAEKVVNADAATATAAAFKMSKSRYQEISTKATKAKDETMAVTPEAQGLTRAAQVAKLRIRIQAIRQDVKRVTMRDTNPRKSNDGGKPEAGKDERKRNLLQAMQELDQAAEVAEVAAAGEESKVDTGSLAKALETVNKKAEQVIDSIGKLEENSAAEGATSQLERARAELRELLDDVSPLANLADALSAVQGTVASARATHDGALGVIEQFANVAATGKHVLKQGESLLKQTREAKAKKEETKKETLHELANNVGLLLAGPSIALLTSVEELCKEVVENIFNTQEEEICNACEQFLGPEPDNNGNSAPKQQADDADGKEMTPILPMNA